jgi:hypothetical protein
LIYDELPVFEISQGKLFIIFFVVFDDMLQNTNIAAEELPFNL